MNWFDQLKNALAAYYPPGQPGDIVGYLQGSASPMIWRSMALGDRPRNQMMILGSLPPTQEAWVAAGVAQRDQIQVIRFAALNGFIVLYGGFVLRPQVTIQVAQIRSSVISILGQVGKPGRYPIEVVGSRVSEMVAAAGGVAPGGADVVTLVGTRNGRSIKLDIDMPAILQSGKSELDLSVENGDIIYVDRAPSAYIYGEVQKPGQFRLERGMNLMQAIAQSGGVTLRGTQRGIKVHRRAADGAVTVSDIDLNDPVLRDDVIYVKESLF